MSQNAGQCFAVAASGPWLSCRIIPFLARDTRDSRDKPVNIGANASRVVFRDSGHSGQNSTYSTRLTLRAFTNSAGVMRRMRPKFWLSAAVALGSQACQYWNWRGYFCPKAREMSLRTSSTSKPGSRLHRTRKSSTIAARPDSAAVTRSPSDKGLACDELADDFGAFELSITGGSAAAGCADSSVDGSWDSADGRASAFGPVDFNGYLSRTGSDSFAVDPEAISCRSRVYRTLALTTLYAVSMTQSRYSAFPPESAHIGKTERTCVRMIVLSIDGNLRVPIFEGFRLMPPDWFLQLWIDPGGRGGISQGLRFWRQLRETPERYGGGQWRRPVLRGPVLAERFGSRSRMTAIPGWAWSRRGSEAGPGR